jgi:hypothetical protein
MLNRGLLAHFALVFLIIIDEEYKLRSFETSESELHFHCKLYKNLNAATVFLDEILYSV